MNRHKFKPLDRYPYMDNNLKNWDNEFVTNETFALGFEYLDNKIDEIIVGSGFVTHEEYDPFVNDTETSLSDLYTITDYLQYQIDHISLEGYVTEEVFNTYTAQTDTTLADLQEQIDAIDLTDYVTTDDLAIVLDEYVELTTFNTYTTQTAETLTDLQDQIDDIIANYVTFTDYASNETAGVIKTDEDSGISVDENGKISINGRLGQTEAGGLYYPPTTIPEEVRTNSIMVTEAVGNAAYSNRIFALAGGVGVNLKVTAQPGATRFEISNTFANRFLAAACRGGLLTLDADTAKIKTVKILNVYLANDTEQTPLIPYSGPNESRNNIIIETAEAFSDTDSLTKIRVYGRMRSDSSVYIGLNVGNGDTDSSVGKNLLLGQNVLSMSGNNIVVGNSHYVGQKRNAVFGGNHIINTSGTLAAGYGHDTTNGSDNVVPLGQYSLVDEDTLLAIGDGTSNTVRHNIFEVRKDGSIIIADRNITQELTEATNNITTLQEDVAEINSKIENYYEKILTQDEISRIFQPVTTEGFRYSSVKIVLYNRMVTLEFVLKATSEVPAGSYSLPAFVQNTIEPAFDNIITGIGNDPINSTYINYVKLGSYYNSVITAKTYAPSTPSSGFGVCMSYVSKNDFQTMMNILNPQE